MLNVKYSTDVCIKFKFVDREVNRRPTRGKKNFKKYFNIIFVNFFSNRPIQMWNSLPDSVIDVNNINNFKHKLDKLWANENVKFR